MKLIKKYLEFIKEDVNIHLNEHFDISILEDESLWNLSEREIRECFIEFEDAGYEIDIDLIFMGDSYNVDYYNNGHRNETINVRRPTTKTKAGMMPGYWINISVTPNINIKTDLSEHLKEIYSYITEEANANIEIYDKKNYYPYDLNKITSNINHITIKNGIYDNRYTNDESKVYIILCGEQKNSRLNITEMDLLEYYKWDKDEIIIENDKLYIELEIDKLVDMFVLSDQKDFIKVLKNRDNLWDLFDMENFCSSDTDYKTIFNILDSDNFKLFMKCLVKEYGGVNKILASISEYNDEDYEFLEDKSEDVILEYVSRNGANDLFDFLFEDSEVIKQIIYIIANYEMDAYAEEYYNKLVEAFDKKIGEYFEFTKNQKEITKKYYSQEKRTTESYQKISTFYKIEFNNSWLNDIEDEDLEDYLDNDSNSLEELMCSWFDSYYSKEKLSPNFPEYANVDSKKFNSDLKGALQSYISDPNETEIEI